MTVNLFTNATEKFKFSWIWG